MEQYRKLLLEFSDMLISMSEFVEGSDTGIQWSVICFYFIFWLSFAVLYLVIKIRTEGYESRIGTVSFWIVLSIATFGIGGVVCKLLDTFMGNSRVHIRPIKDWVTIVTPTLISILICLMGVDMYMALYIGFVVAILQIVWATLAPINKNMSILLPDKKNIECYLGSLISSKKLRKKILNNPTGIFSYSVKGEDVQLKRLFECELQTYLLIREKDKFSIIREYKKADGTMIKVMELGNLIYAQIFDSIAAMILLIMVMTPYVPMLIKGLINILG